MKKNRHNLMLAIVLISMFVMQTTMVSAIIDRPRPPPPDPDPTYRMYGYIKDSNTGAPISGALVKFYGESSVYIGSTTTSVTGYFNYYKSMTFYDWIQIRVTKYGYSEVRDTDVPSGTYYYFGTNYMEPLNYYDVHGYVEDDATFQKVSDATVDIYGRLTGSSTYSYISTTSTDLNGGFSKTFYSANDYDSIRVILFKDGFYSNAFYKSSSTSDFNYGTLYLENIARQFALIVGISDYKDSSVPDLSYCDEDANDWYSYLSSTAGYDVIYVLGDPTSTYSKYDGLATESNIKQYINTIMTTADYNDNVAIILNGHGKYHADNDVGFGAYDLYAGESGEDGLLNDDEFAALVNDFDANRLFLFFDFCHSGGMLGEIAATQDSSKVYATSAVQGGINALEPEGAAPFSTNGCWTYFFLHVALEDEGETTMEAAFDTAWTTWVQSPVGWENGPTEPDEYDGNPSSSFYL